MNYFRYITTLVLLTLLISCSEPTIDTTSDATIEASTQRVRDSLPPSKREEFDEALQELTASQLDMAVLFALSGDSSSNIKNKMLEGLNGKTGDQIIAEAERIKAERLAREREQALNEIQELEAKKQAADTAKTELKRFEVLRSRFYIQETDFMGDQAVIELSVKNGTDSAISRAYFIGTLASPNRSIPWHKDSFNYTISGGLEPGEEASWRLSPNILSGWGHVDAPADAVFTVTVEELDGPDGETLYSLKDFSERDAERLRELKMEYGMQ